MATYKKGDQETLDFGIDWSDVMTDEGVTISSSTWVVPTGITEESNSYSTTGTTIVLSGGTAGTAYKLTNVITTSGIPIMERTFYVLVVEDKLK